MNKLLKNVAKGQHLYISGIMLLPFQGAIPPMTLYPGRCPGLAGHWPYRPFNTSSEMNKLLFISVTLTRQ